MERLVRAGGFLTTAVALAIPLSAQAQSRSTPAGPFVEISVEGSGVLLRPGRIRYQITAEPGSYISVFLISPTGRVSLLNPDERVIQGSGRREIFRDTRAGFTPGESYLVAVATRSAEHHASLVRLSRGESRLAAGYYSAELAMDDLVMNTVRRAGDDFSVSYASFRLLADEYPRAFAYNEACQNGMFSPSGTYLENVIYGREIVPAPSYVLYDDPARFLTYSDLLTLDATCRGQRFQVPFFIVRGSAPSVPTPAGDTSRVDGVAKLFPPRAPRPPLPYDPDPRGANPGVRPADRAVPSRRVDPILSPSVPVEAATPMPQAFNHPEVPVSRSIPAEPVTRVTPPTPPPMPTNDPIPLRASPPRPSSSPPPPPKPTPVPVTPPPAG